MKSNKKFVVEANFIKEAHKLDLTLTEFLLLLYFENSDDFLVDFDDIEKKLKIDKPSILEGFNNLLSKKIISLNSEKNKEGKICDRIALDNFYNNIKETKMKEDNSKLKDDIFSIFEREFRRPLNGMEYEVIKAWTEKLYSKELILAALKEAVYNGATNIRYIDTILHEWNKKGFKNKEDVENYMKNNYSAKKLEDTLLLDYNWLEDYEK